MTSSLELAVDPHLFEEYYLQLFKYVSVCLRRFSNSKRNSKLTISITYHHSSNMLASGCSAIEVFGVNNEPN